MRRRPTFTRADRLGALMRDEVERVVDFELTTAVARHIQITDAVLAGDLGHLRVRYVMRANDDASASAQEALDRAAGYVARSLAETLQLHRAPKVVFSFDKEYARLRRLRAMMAGGDPALGLAPTGPAASGVASATAPAPGAATGPGAVAADDGAA